MRHRPKAGRLKRRKATLQGISGGRAEPYGDDTSIGLVGTEERSTAKPDPSIDRGCEAIQPAKPNADSVVDEADEERSEGRRDES